MLVIAWYWSMQPTNAGLGPAARKEKYSGLYQVEVAVSKTRQPYRVKSN